ncbi:MAG: hypothetical protein JW779_10825 [Candidatus Thorarchaeota archaeon]|nr:hypothetical protein [Candidatus Thorarchaeota archaeon]
MEDKKQLLIQIIMEENVSAIVTMGERLGIDPDDVITMIGNLVSEGRLNGTLTEDKVRFFKSSVKVSEAPVIPREDKPPSFLNYNTKPGKLTALIGFIIIAAGLVVNSFATTIEEANFAAIVIFFGLLVLFAGLYFIARRNSPD